MKKSLLVVLCVVLAIAMFAGCAAKTEEPAAEAAAPAEEEAATEEADTTEETAATDDTKCVIGLSAGTESNQFHHDVNLSIKNVAKDMSVEVVYAVSEFQAEMIIPKVQSLLQQGANVIVDFNVNSQIGGSIVDVVNEEGGKGVIGLDVEYVSPSGDKAWFMGANNSVAGQLCGEAIADYAIKNKDGKLDYLVLLFNSENGEEVKKRVSAAYDGLKNKGIEIAEDKIEYIDVAMGGGSETTVQGKDKFTAWLTAHPDAHSIGVVGVNDETTTGALAGAETVGRVEDCIFASHNVSQVYMDGVASGTLAEEYTGSVAYYPERYGEYVVPLAIDIASGANTNPDEKITVDHVFITPDMVEDYQKGYEEYKAAWTIE